MIGWLTALLPVWAQRPATGAAAVLQRFTAHQGSVLCGYIAYAAMLSGMPFLIFATALAGHLVGEGTSTQAVEALFQAVPEHVARTLEPVLQEILGERRGGILTLSAVGTVWAASNGVEAIRVALDRAYLVEKPRHFLWRRLLAIGFVFIGFVTFVALALLIILAPLVRQAVEAFTTIAVPVGTEIARYAVGACLLFAFFWVLHRLLPSRAMRGVRLWPGIVTSVVIWVAIASGLSIYLAYSSTYAVTYGALAGVIVTLLFFYLTGAAIILGAEVNAVVNGIGDEDLAAESGPTLL
ncbi:MAG: YihY/virulence factor BrkB family protein [Pseudomonadota bacterium]